MYGISASMVFFNYNKRSYIDWKELQKRFYGRNHGKFHDVTDYQHQTALIIFMIGLEIHALLTIAAGWYILSIRNRHANEINKTELRFGVVAEKIDLLKKSKRTILAIMKLNYWNAMVTGIYGLLVLLYLVTKKELFPIAAHIIMLVGLALNPIICLISQPELRKIIIRLYHKYAPRNNQGQAKKHGIDGTDGTKEIKSIWQDRKNINNNNSRVESKLQIKDKVEDNNSQLQ